MSDGPARRKRGRPPKLYARKLRDFNDIILKVANSPRMVKTPNGQKEISFFELNVINMAAENPSTRISASRFVDLTKRAAREEEEREAREKRDAKLGRMDPFA